MVHKSSAQYTVEFVSLIKQLQTNITYNLLSLGCQSISPHYHLAADGVLHPSQSLAHGTDIPAVLFNVRLGLIPRTQMRMRIVHGPDFGVATAFIEHGGPDQPGLEFGEGNLMILSGIPHLLLGCLVDAAATIDIVREVFQLLERDAVGMVRVD